MAVLIEATSVVIKRSVINYKWPGGWSGFVIDAPNQTLCADIFLARVGFMSPVDVESYIKTLKNKGLIYLSKVVADDLVVASQLHGFSTTCDWAMFGHINYGNDPKQRIAACMHIDDEDNSIITPDGWKYEGSLSHTFAFAPTEQIDKSLKFIKHDNGVDVYLNELTGEKVYIGRTSGK